MFNLGQCRHGKTTDLALSITYALVDLFLVEVQGRVSYLLLEADFLKLLAICKVDIETLFFFRLMLMNPSGMSQVEQSGPFISNYN